MERPDLFLPFADQTHRHRLHASRGKAAVHLPPQPGRQLVAYEPVQHAPGLLRVHTVLIDRFRMLDRFPDRRRRDLMESDAHRRFRIHIEKFGQMPGNGFPFAVRVRREKDVFRFIRFLLQLPDHIFPAVRMNVLRPEAVLHIHAERALRQIPQMPHRRHDPVVRAEDPLDRPRFGRGFHHDQMLSFRIRRALKSRLFPRHGSRSLFPVSDSDRSLDRHSSPFLSEIIKRFREAPVSGRRKVPAPLPKYSPSL